mgnify:CR=1 FL=1
MAGEKTKKKPRNLSISWQTVEKAQQSWAFSIFYGIMVPGDLRCWNEEKWNEESLK